MKPAAQPRSYLSTALIVATAVAVASPWLCWEAPPAPVGGRAVKSLSAPVPPEFAREAGASAPQLWSAFQRAFHQIETVTNAGRAQLVSQSVSQSYQIRYEDAGAMLRADGHAAGLQLRAFGRGENLTPLPVVAPRKAAPPLSGRLPAAPPAGGETDTVVWDRGAVMEWMINGTDGTRQWFRVQQRPAASEDGPLELVLEPQGNLEPQADGTGQRVVFRPKGAGTNAAPVFSYEQVRAWDARGRALPALLAVVDASVRVRVTDEAAVYPVTIDPVWLGERKLFMRHVSPGAQLGYTVAMNDRVAVVGAPFAFAVSGGEEVSYNQHAQAWVTNATPRTGRVLVFRRSNSGQFEAPRDLNLNEELVLPGDPTEGAMFGHALALNGNYLVVGAPGAMARVEPSAWQEFRDTAMTLFQVSSVVTDAFNPMTSVNEPDWSGTIVDPLRYRRPAGAVYVFEERAYSTPTAAGFRFEQIKKLQEEPYFELGNERDSVPLIDERFGYAVAFRGNRLVIGVPNNRDWRQAEQERDTEFVGQAVKFAADQLIGLIPAAAPLRVVASFPKLARYWSLVAPGLKVASSVAHSTIMAATVQRGAYAYNASDDEVVSITAGHAGPVYGRFVVYDMLEPGLFSENRNDGVSSRDGLPYLLTHPGLRFGSTVALSPDARQLVVGAMGAALQGVNTVACGALVTYEKRDDEAMRQTGVILGLPGYTNGVFGGVVEFMGSDLLVALPAQGAVALLTRGVDPADTNKYVWTPGALLTAPGGSTTNLFGYAMAVKDDLLLVGAPRHIGAYQPSFYEQLVTDQVTLRPDAPVSGELGAAFLYRRAGTNFTLLKTFYSMDPLRRSRFGAAVALTGENSVLIGAPDDDSDYDRNPSSGAVYLYSRFATVAGTVEGAEGSGTPGRRFPDDLLVQHQTGTRTVTRQIWDAVASRAVTVTNVVPDLYDYEERYSGRLPSRQHRLGMQGQFSFPLRIGATYQIRPRFNTLTEALFDGAAFSGEPEVSPSQYTFTLGENDMTNLVFALQGPSIAGHVTVNGQPLAGVTVTTAGRYSVRTALTDTNGYYTLANLTPRHTNYVVTPTLAGREFLPTSRTVFLTGDTNGVDFEVRTYSLTGRVTRQGGGLAGVPVSLNGSLITVTSSDGSYRFDGLLAGSTNRVVPLAEDLSFEPAQREVVVPFFASVQNADFEARRAVRGKVVRLGLPVSGVSVRVGPNAAVTDALGRYELRLPVGTHEVTLTVPGGGGLFYEIFPPSISVDLTLADRAGADFQLHTYALSGVMVSGNNTNVLVRNAPVYWKGLTTKTDAQGRFAFVGLGPDVGWVNDHPVPGQSPLILNRDRASVLALSYLRAVTGVVTNQQGQPVSNVILQSSAGSRAVTDPLGRYEIIMDQLNEELRAFSTNGLVRAVRHHTLQNQDPAAFYPGTYPGDSGVAFVTSPFILSGKVLAGTNPVANATIKVNGQVAATTDAHGRYSLSNLVANVNAPGISNRINPEHVLTVERGGSSFSPGQRLVTLVPGRFLNHPKSADTLPVIVQSSFGLRLGVETTAPYVSGGETGLDFVQETAPLVGRVTAGGRGVQFVTIRAGNQTTTTREDGTYVFTGLPDGEYELIPEQPGTVFSPVARTVTLLGTNQLGAKDFVIPGVAIGGAVRHAHQPLAGAEVTIEPGASGPLTTFTNATPQPLGTRTDATGLVVTQQITVNLAGTVRGLRPVVQLAGLKQDSFQSVGPKHRFDTLTLISPAGTTLTLDRTRVEERGVSGDQQGRYTARLTAVGEAGGPLTEFNGQTNSGTWTLIVRTAHDPGFAGITRLDFATLEFRTYTPATLTRVTTDTNGQFLLPDQPPGVYRVSVAAPSESPGLSFSPEAVTFALGGAPVTNLAFAVELPMASNLVVQTFEGQATNFALPVVVPAGQAASFELLNPPPLEVGHIELNPTNGLGSFHPHPAFSGSTNFQYRFTAGALTSAVATVTLNVSPVGFYLLNLGQNRVDPALPLGRRSARLTLSSRAGDSGLDVQLSSGSPLLRVPASVRVPPRGLDVDFTYEVVGLAANEQQLHVITAARGGYALSSGVRIRHVPYEVSGRLLRAGSPLPGHIVRLRQDNGATNAPVRTAVTDAAGRYAFAEVEPAGLPGFAPAPASRRLEVLSSSVTNADVVFNALPIPLDLGRFLKLGDGSGGHVILPAAAGDLIGTNAFSLDAWVRLAVPPTNGAALLDFATTNGTERVALGFEAGTGRLEFSVHSGTNLGRVIAPLELPTNRWFHVAASWSPAPTNAAEGVGRLWLMGAEVAAGPLPVPAPAVRASAVLGRNGVTGAGLAGALDDVTFGPGGIAPELVAEMILSGGQRREGLPHARYRMDEEAGETFTDAGPNALHGRWSQTGGVTRQSANEAVVFERDPVTFELPGTSLDLGPLAVEIRTHPQTNARLEFPEEQTVRVAPLSDSAEFNPAQAGFTYVLVNSAGASDPQAVRLAARGLELTNLVVDPGWFLSGATGTGTVQFAQAVPVGGRTIHLSSDSRHAVVPATLTVAAGSRSASFPITTTSMTDHAVVRLTCGYFNGAWQRITTNFALLPTQFIISGTLQQAGEPVAGMRLDLAGNGTNLVSFTTSFGRFAFGPLSNGSYSITSGAPFTSLAPSPAILQLNGSNILDAVLQVRTPVVQNLSVSPASQRGGFPASVGLTLDVPAPVGGWTVPVQFTGVSSNEASYLPTNIVFQPGQTTAGFVLLPEPTASPKTITVQSPGPTTNGHSASLNVLASQLSVLGRVTSGGRPVRGITMTLQPGGLTAVTGELGEYAFTNPPAGNVTVQPQGGGPAFSPTSRSVTVAGGAVTDVDFTLPAAELLALQLATNRVASAQPLTATVVLTGPAPADGRTVRLSVADTLRSSVPGSVTVPPGATQASFVITNAAVSGTYENQLRAQLEGKLAETRLSASYTLLPELRAISGLITHLGQPVTNVAVRLESGGTTVRLVTNGMDGRFSFAGVTSARYRMVPERLGTNGLALVANFTPLAYDVELIDLDLTNVNFTLEPPFLKSITILNDTRAVTAGSSVLGKVELSEAAPDTGYQINLAASHPGLVTLTPAPAFVLPGEREATFIIRTVATNVWTPVTLTAALGGRSASATLSVEPLLTLSGTLRRGGQPFGLAVITVGTGPQARQINVQPDGTFTIPDLTQGVHLLTPQNGSLRFTPTNRTVALFRTSLSGLAFEVDEPRLVNLFQPFGLEGLPRRGGSPVTDLPRGGDSLPVRVTLSHEVSAVTGPVRVNLSASSTNATLPAHLDIQPGTSSNAVLVAFRESAAPQEITLTAELAGEVRTFTVNLQPTLRTIAGNVGAAPGLFSSARAVEVRPVPTGQAAVLFTDSAGNYQFTGVAGLYEVRAFDSQDYVAGPGTQSVNTTTGAVANVNFTIFGVPPVGLDLTPAVARPGQNVAGLVRFRGRLNDFSTGQTVNFSSSAPDLIPVPASLTLQPLQSQFPLGLVVAGGITQETNVVITVSVGGTSIASTVRVQPVFRVDGRVTVGGAARAYQPFTLAGDPGTFTGLSDASGNLRLNDVLNGTYTLTPMQPGYAFTPASRTVTVNGADVVVPDFVATPLVQPLDLRRWASFDGRHLALPDIRANDLFANGFTCEAWVFRTGTNTPPVLFNFRDFLSGGVSLRLDAATGRAQAAVRYADGRTMDTVHTFAEPDAVVPAGRWVHVALTITSGGPYRLYLNGELAGHATGLDTPRNNNFNLVSITNHMGAGLEGAMDNVRLWNRPLSQAEVQAGLLAASRAGEPGLIGEYHFDRREAGPQTADTSGLNRIGTFSAARPPVQGTLVYVSPSDANGPFTIPLAGFRTDRGPVNFAVSANFSGGALALAGDIVTVTPTVTANSVHQFAYTVGGQATQWVTMEFVLRQATGLTLSTNAAYPGDPVMGTVSANEPAAGAVRVRLTSSDPAVTVPAMVEIPLGATSANFPVNVTDPGATNREVIIQASSGGVSFDAGLTARSVAGLGFVVSGTVRVGGPSGAPVAGTTVTLTQDGVSTNIVTGTNGTFLFAGLPAGSVTLTAVHAGYTIASASRTFTLNQNRVEHFYFAEPSLEPFGFYLTEFSTSASQFPPNGVVRLVGIAPPTGWTVRLESSAPEALGVPSTVTIPAGQTLLVFPVQPRVVSATTNVTVTGRVTRASDGVTETRTATIEVTPPQYIVGGHVRVRGELVDGVTVRLMSGATVIQQTTTFGGGRYYLSPVPAGIFAVQVVHPTESFFNNPRVLSVSTNVTEVNFASVVPLAVAGTVVGSTGVLAGAGVSLVTSAGTLTTNTAVDGSYRFDHLAPGPVTLSAAAPGEQFLGGPQTVTLQENSILDLDFLSTLPVAPALGRGLDVVPEAAGQSRYLAKWADLNNAGPRSSTDFGGPFTVEFWFRPDATTTRANARLFEMGNRSLVFASFLEDAVVLRFDDATGRLVAETATYLDSRSLAAPAGTELQPGQWVHVALTVQGQADSLGTGTLLLNGRPVATGPLRVPREVKRYAARLGMTVLENGLGPLTPSCDGQFDELRIWTVARTPTQIRAGMVTSPAPSTAGLQANYRFEGDGNDSSVQGNHAVLGAPIVPLTTVALNAGSPASPVTVRLAGADLTRGAVAFAIETAPYASVGSLSVVNGNEVTFTRGPEFPGTATFTYRVTSTNGSSAPQVVTLTGPAAPLVITQAPASVLLLPGGDATFQVGITGPGPLGYQWFFNATNALAGATNAVLTLTNVQAANLGAYRVVAANASQSVTSAVANLAFLIPPVITREPTNDTVVIGAGVNLSAAATGPQLVYQWFRNQAVIPGATNATLTFASADLSHAGEYFLRVTNLAGTATSQPAHLLVTRAHFPPPQRPAPGAIQAGGFPLRLFGEVGRTFRIQASPDLRAWRDVTNFTSTGAVFEFLDTSATNASRSYYRIVSP
jgi:hypothetical protein